MTKQGGLHAPMDVPPLPDPSTFTDEQREAHARIYAETGSPIACHMSNAPTSSSDA